MVFAGDLDFNSGPVSDPDYEVADITEVKKQGEPDAQVWRDGQED